MRTSIPTTNQSDAPKVDVIELSQNAFGPENYKNNVRNVLHIPLPNVVEFPTLRSSTSRGRADMCTLEPEQCLNERVVYVSSSGG